MDIATLQAQYREGSLTPSRVIEQTYREIGTHGLRPVWISVVPEEQAHARALALESNADAKELPLYGIPFAVKDNMDVAGMETTAACPAYAYTAEVSAIVVQLLERAGAILIGKTNMDQFATGLVGTRSPYGVCSSVFDEHAISGGSSSGSAVAVAKGLVSFALGTDTAGSGRVPAACNNLVGMKPTRGRVSTAGVVPACRTLDCVSIFAETCGDAARILSTLSGHDARDAYSRRRTIGEGATPWLSDAAPVSGAQKSFRSFRVGIPRADQLQFFGDAGSAAMFAEAVQGIVKLGAEMVVIDYAPFQAAAELLYSGPWVAERLAAISNFHGEHAAEMHPTVERIIGGAARFSAADAFQSAYQLEEVRRVTAETWKQIDVMMLPTVPRSYTIEEVQADPITLNTRLGCYTNFVNLLHLAAVAVPAGFLPEGRPFGVSLIGPAFSDEGILVVADRLHRQLSTKLGGSQRDLHATAALPTPAVPDGCLLMAVVGAHLSGQPLNWQLTQRGGRLVQTTQTSGEYRFYALANTTPPKPGLVYEAGFAGPGIEVEIWALPEDTVGSFVEGVPPPLAIGTLRLASGRMVKGFVAEPAALQGASDITHYGGWRKYLESFQKPVRP